MPHASRGWAVPSSSMIVFVKSPLRSDLEHSIIYALSFPPDVSQH